jgi:hypothetical protein
MAGLGGNYLGAKPNPTGRQRTRGGRQPLGVALARVGRDERPARPDSSLLSAVLQATDRPSQDDSVPRVDLHVDMT